MGADVNDDESGDANETVFAKWKKRKAAENSLSFWGTGANVNDDKRRDANGSMVTDYHDV